MAGRSHARKVLRVLCLVTAIANAGGNALLLVVYPWLFAWLGVPLPADRFSFTAVSAFSFTVGVLAYLVYRDPEGNRALLVVGAVGKGLYALVTFLFWFAGDLHLFYLAFGAWDAVFSVVFALFLLHLLSPDLTVLNRGTILPGGGRRPARRALLLSYSLTGNGRLAMERVGRGLIAGGYQVDERQVQAQEELFRFPLRSLGAFVRIMVRAILRVPAPARPLELSPDRDYDLVVVECQTWFVGMGGPMEGVFQDPTNRVLFEGRDVAVVNVCRGLWRRSQAMVVRWAEACGGRVVGARACENPGREPMRTWSLFLFLGFGEPGRPRLLRPLLTPQFLSDDSLASLEAFGRSLAARG
jgi:hypothetical protein